MLVPVSAGVITTDAAMRVLHQALAEAHAETLAYREVAQAAIHRLHEAQKTEKTQQARITALVNEVRQLRDQTGRRQSAA